MLTNTNRKKLTGISRVFWFLLIYIIVALVWWFISLTHQADQMADFQRHQLVATVDSLATPDQYHRELKQIDSQERRDHAKFILEGVTFLGITILGAMFVFRAVRRQSRLQQQQQHFMMAVTHELKTPIAITRLNLETLLKHRLDEQKQLKILQATLQETERLNNLATNILLSAQLEGGGYLLNRESVEFSAMVEKTTRDFTARFPARTFTEEVEPGCTIEGDPTLLQLLINNLVENAIKYSPRDSTITVGLHRSNIEWKMTVADQGNGIPDDEKSNIFDKFYRVGNENTRTTKGTGLGLYLCSKIAADHDANISVENNHPTGSIFTVSFQQA